ncbi:hypothetical protein [cf. Phormidesmis sp. LEGE 11477]
MGGNDLSGSDLGGCCGD